MSPFRVAYLVTHPIQYQAPLLRMLAAHPEVALHVYFMDEQGARRQHDPEFGMPVQWDIPLLDGYAWRLLPNVSPWPRADHFLRFIHPQVITVLRRERYDALIVHGYAHATEWLAFFGAWTSRTPLLLRGESTLVERRSPWIRILKRVVLGALVRRLEAALAIGALNREFYRAYGMSENRIFPTPYAVDNGRFLADAERFRHAREVLRSRLGWPRDRPVILYAGKLIPRKRPMDLLEAYAGIAAEIPAALVFVGEGSERVRLERAASQRGLRHVFVAGFVNQSEISPYYAAADVLCLPSSHEPWGLVLNEAMCFDLPIIASDAVGAVPDLVRSGGNGFVHRVGDVPALARCLRVVLGDPARRAEMGARSREIVVNYSYEADLRGILDALHTVGARRDAVESITGTDTIRNSGSTL